MMRVSMKFHEILKEKGIFDIWPLLATLTLEVGTYKWHDTPSSDDACVYAVS